MNSPTIVRDAAGNITSRRFPDGTGCDCTYDDKGNEVTYRLTDGTGYTSTYDENGNVLSYRLPDAPENNQPEGI